MRARCGAGARVLTIVTISALSLAACGDGDEPPVTPDLDVQLGMDSGTSAEREGRAEVVIQSCMEAQGFDYVAVDPAARQAALLGSTGVSEADFEDQFGYGITTLYERRREQAASGPNQKIRASLGEAEKAAYDRALSGDNLDASFFEAVDSGDFTRLGGCTKKAAESVYGGADVLQSVLSGLAELEARVLADPRMAKAVAAWAACMRAEGFELANPEDVDIVLKRKLTAIVGSDPLAAVEAGATPGYDQAALTALQKEEVTMVAADIACEEEHIAKVEDEVSTQFQAEFREQNVDLIAKVPKA